MSQLGLEEMGLAITLEERLRVQFEAKMALSKSPVFVNFETYAQTLPRRVVGDTDSVLNLYQFPFWADQKGVRSMALDLEYNRRNLQGQRRYVRYATAPTAAGKTASILPAFLDSAEHGRSIDGHNVSFSYYIYLAFSNNNGRNFRAEGVHSDYREQGAAFMLQCLTKFFDNDYGTVRLRNQTIAEIETIQESMKALLNTAAPRGRCLVHIDEHGSMVDCPNDSDAALFRRGAIQTLANIPGVVVVATFTKLLTEIDPGGSSSVCRYPLAVPLLDIDAMATELPEFDMLLPSRELTAQESTLLSSVRFRLAQKILSIGLLALHGAVRVDDMNALKRAFKDVVHCQTVLTDRLVSLLSVLRSEPQSLELDIISDSSAKMLCGVPEAEWGVDTVKRQARDILLTPNGLVTTQLNTLLRMNDPTCDVFGIGQNRFYQILHSQDRSLLSSTPLECAYSWVLSARSAIYGRIRFGTHVFDLRCINLSAGRLFIKSFREDFEQLYQKMEADTFYYALEGTGSGYKQDHPLGDLFFKTTNGKLVLIDFTAFNDAEFLETRQNKLPILTKRNRMIAWVKLWKEKYNVMGVTLHGVVLAPFNTTHYDETSVDGNSVTIVHGDRAMRDLGGLSQLLFWFAPPLSVEMEIDGAEDQQESA